MEHQVRDQKTLQTGGCGLVTAPARDILLRPFHSIVFLSLFLSAAGCASYTDETRAIRSDYMARSYQTALNELENSSLKDSDSSELLYLLEKAMILDRMGQREKSRRLLIEADKLADKLYTVSVSKTAASFVMNDAATDYSGEDYEKVAIHTQLALSFLADGNLESARVQARKINSKLNEINQGYDSHKNRYGEDAFALYLAGMIYEARGEWDSAIIDYWKALNLYEGDYRLFVRGGVPESLVRSLYAMLIKRNRSDRIAVLEKKYPAVLKEQIAAGKNGGDDDYGEVAVIHEIGHIAVKVPEEFVMPFGKQVIRFSWPVIRRSNDASILRDSGVEVEGRSIVMADNVQDMDAIAAVSLEDRRLRMVAKQAARLLAKGQLTEQAYRNFGPLGGIAANVYSVVSETADTRSWSLLPEAYSVTRIRLKPGTHTLRIKTGGRQSRIEKVEVKKGKLTILRDVG